MGSTLVPKPHPSVNQDVNYSSPNLTGQFTSRSHLVKNTTGLWAPTAGRLCQYTQALLPDHFIMFIYLCVLSVIKSQSVHTTITVQPVHCIKAAATVWWQSGSCIFSTRNTNKTLISARPNALLICLQTMRVQLMIPFISLTSLFSHKYVKLCKMYVHLHVCSSCRSLLLCP